MTDHHESCEATRDVMGLLISSDATVPDLAAARDHLVGCAQCRGYLKQMQEDERQLMDFASSHEQRIRDLQLKAVNALPEVPVRPRKVNDRWRWIMSRGIRPLAAAAAIVIFLVVWFQGTDPTFEAWAEVMDTVRQATTSQFRLRDMDRDGIEARRAYSPGGTSHRTYDDGRLVEAMFVDFEKGQGVFLAYPMKLAARMTMSEEMIQDFREYDPAETFNFLQEYEFEELGNQRIDGREAAGIRITDGRFLAERMEHAELELWVDPETRLPLRFDVTGEVAGRTRTRHVRFYDFRWNEPLPEDEFYPEIPRDYRLLGEIDLVVDEEHCLDGLRIFANVVGRYPSTLAYESLKKELLSSPGSREQEVGDRILDTFRVRPASSFYGRLVKDEMSVVYFGHTVRPGDHDQVLLRWKTGDDQYRVVHGDLQVETVSGEALLEME